MPVAHLDPTLSVRIGRTRQLVYTTSAAADDDRPPHVRAASGLARIGGRLVVVQDDTAFVATVGGDEVSAIALPRGPGGRRRFEVALGNKRDKLDLEACVAVDDEVWAFGSGSTPERERIVAIGYRTQVVDAAPLYARLRAAVNGALNIEGVAVLAAQVWLLHRGNTGAGDRPAVIQLERAAFASWLGGSGPLPRVTDVMWFDLGSVGGVQLGFTDAVAVGDRVFYLAAGEASANAVDDGAVAGSQLGVIDAASVRAASLSRDGSPIKAEGLAFSADDPFRGWIAIDPDDVDRPAELCEIELVGPW